MTYVGLNAICTLLLQSTLRRSYTTVSSRSRKRILYAKRVASAAVPLPPAVKAEHGHLVLVRVIARQ